MGTPSRPAGTADLQYVFAAVEGVAKLMTHYAVVVTKSTVPVGTGAQVEQIIKQHYQGDFDYASCPEFLREGCAVDDFFTWSFSDWGAQWSCQWRDAGSV